MESCGACTKADSNVSVEVLDRHFYMVNWIQFLRNVGVEDLKSL